VADSGIFGGGILGLFLLSLLHPLRLWQGLVSSASPCRDQLGHVRTQAARRSWAEASFDPIITGHIGTAVLMVVALLFAGATGTRQCPVPQDRSSWAPPESERCPACFWTATAVIGTALSEPSDVFFPTPSRPSVCRTISYCSS
jgi:hypothetical protein